MITTDEINLSNLTYTKKDFYQIYPEELDYVTKLTNRWDPSSSNETDPGVVLLKVQAAIADKLCYTVDKNTLEHYVPSLTQVESMRRVIEPLGYTMKYYQSAELDVTFMWNGSNSVFAMSTFGNSITGILTLPKYTTILTNDAEDVSFVLLDDIIINYKQYAYTGRAIEGTLVDFEINDDNIVRMYNLDDSFRLYFPESAVAENGVFIVDSTDESIEWTKVDNLNTQAAKQKVWKFEYSSKEKSPYIQFPSDVASIIGEGLVIKYIRTAGASGNIAAKTLTKLSNATTITGYESGSTSTTDVTIENDSGYYQLLINNAGSTTNGADPESIDEAYNNYKKTIGTFDTLVTCRDYQNAIYNIVDLNNSPLVSNNIVADIRDDINRSITVATYTDFGLQYKNQSTQTITEKSITGTTSGGEEATITVSETVDDMTHFDLYVYPFFKMSSSITTDTYNKAFTFDGSILDDIEAELEQYKTISHNITVANVESNDIFCIAAKYALNSKISTNYKVNTSEQKAILTNVKKALMKEFNPRNIDFGEELNYDTILSTIKNADSRIKNVSLDSPVITPYACLMSGIQYPLAESSNTGAAIQNNTYYKLIAKNILAGRLSLFNYNNDFASTFNESGGLGIIGSKTQSYPESEETAKQTNALVSMKPELEISMDIIEGNTGYTLGENEAIQLLTKSMEISYQYPAYVNIYIKGGLESFKKEIPYKFTDDDELWVEYTDTNSSVHKLIYTPTAVKETIDDGLPTTSDWTGVMQFSFNCSDYDSLTKSSVLIDGSTEQYYKSLGASDSVSIMEESKEEITSNLCKLLWYTNEEDGTLTFDANGERLLEEGEYLFRTNDAETDLIIYGSGTLLQYTANTVWNLANTDDDLDLDDIANNGISAFADVNWEVKSFSAESLKIWNTDIITLTGDVDSKGNRCGDVIKDVVLASGETATILNNSWVELSSFTYNNTKESSADTRTWYIRSRLLVNMGPSTYYKLPKHLDTEEVYSNIRLYTQQLDEEKGVYVETEIPSSEGNAFISEHNDKEHQLYLKSNYIVSTNGTKYSLKRYSTSDTSVEINDILIDCTNYSDVIADTKVSESSTSVALSFVEDYNTVDFSKYNNIKLSLGKDSEAYTSVMLYIKGVSDTVSLKLSTEIIKWAKLSDVINKTHTELDSIWSSDILTLSEGINIIVFKGTGTVTLTAYNGETASYEDITATIAKPREFEITENDNYLDIYNHNLGITDMQTFTKNYITKYSNFYYTLPINNSKKIDVETINDAECAAWFSKNNVCNKFVICQLDTSSFENIQIATSSLL